MIVARGLSKRYGDKVAVEELSFEIRPGVLIRAVIAVAPSVEVTRNPDDTALLVGIDTARVGDIAAAERLVLHELATRTASLEEAFFEATGATEEYVGRLSPIEPSVPADSVAGGAL